MPTPSASELSFAEALQRFRDDAEGAFGAPLRSDDCLALAVSGGPDSMALLALAPRALPCRIVAATVDHGLREASAAEARMVAAHCAAIGVAHATLPVAIAAAGNLHGNARTARYTALTDWAGPQGAVALATAHHADDQAETFLMRAVRGTGIGGLAGIRRRGAFGGVTLIRPLLGWRRGELREIAAQLTLPFVDDPSNADPRFERARVRALLAETPWLDPVALAQTAAHVGEADRTIEDLVQWLWTTRVTTDGDRLVLDVTHLPREMRRRLVRRAVAQVSGRAQDGSNVEHVLDSLEQGKRGTQAEVLASPKDTIWRFEAAPPRRSH